MARKCQLCGGDVNWFGQCLLQRETRGRRFDRRVATLVLLALIPLLTG